MKKVFFLIVIILLAANFTGCQTKEVKDEPFKIMTQNLRYFDDTNRNSVLERAPRFKKLIEEYQPDIIGTQESGSWQLKLYEYFSKDYDIVGTPGMMENYSVNNLILYRKAQFDLVDKGIIWLSNTPEEADSKLEDSQGIRSAVWVVLKNKTSKKEFLVINTHLDHPSNETGDAMRKAQITILMDYFAEKMEQYPTIVTGDFNCTFEKEPYKIITSKLQDTKETAQNNLAQVSYTWHDYGEKNEKIIDFIFHDGRTTAIDYNILTNQYDGYVSDHYAVMGSFMIE